MVHDWLSNSPHPVHDGCQSFLASPEGELCGVCGCHSGFHESLHSSSVSKHEQDIGTFEHNHAELLDVTPSDSLESLEASSEDNVIIHHPPAQQYRNSLDHTDDFSVFFSPTTHEHQISASAHLSHLISQSDWSGWTRQWNGLVRAVFFWDHDNITLTAPHLSDSFSDCFIVSVYSFSASIPTSDSNVSPEMRSLIENNRYTINRSYSSSIYV